MRHVSILLLALALLPLAAGAQAVPATRGDFVTALWESAGAVPFDVEVPFTDVAPGDPWATAVGWARAEGLVRGVGGGLFAPDRPITREEAAVLLRRWAGRLGRSTFLPEGVAACNDYADTSSWAGDDLYWACGVGLLPWSGQGRLDPSGALTQDEMAAVIRFFTYGTE